MDKTDKKILSLLKGNARISYQEPGDIIDMSRVAAHKEVDILVFISGQVISSFLTLSSVVNVLTICRIRHIVKMKGYMDGY